LLTRFDITTGERYVQNIRFNNSAFAFISFGITTDRSIFEVDKPYIFRIQRALYHNIGSLILPSGQPKFVQIYFYDGNFDTHARWQATRNPALKLKIFNVSSQDMRNYNLPVASEIAAIITDDDTIDSGRDIILTTQQSFL
ncbi:26841_t:CDS:2, partial [Racocetra persica]